MRYLNGGALLLASIAWLGIGCQSSPKVKADQKQNTQPIIVGAMKNVMHKGELAGIIHLDTIKDKNHLYGMGPVEYLTGELLVMDGISYKATVINDTAMNIEQTFDVKAPFFGYAHIASWKQSPLPDSVIGLKQLENYLLNSTKDLPQPYFFKISAITDSATVHLMNLPPGTKVSKPEDANQGKKNYTVTNQKVELLGFFSTQHQAIFTHHDTFLHLHLITENKQTMGHLDKLKLKKGTATLFLPE